MWERFDNQEVCLEAAILYRKRNSSLVKRTCAKNVTGLKHDTEATGSRILRDFWSGRRAFQGLRRLTVRTAGALGRDNAGLSSDKTGEKPVRRKPKGSWVKLIFPGLVGS